MESLFVRYRNLLVLLAILLAQIIGLAVQVRRTGEGRSTLDPGDGSGVRLIRLWANALVSPPERLIHSSNLGADKLWQNYLDLRHVREQNQDLQKTIDRLRLEQAALLEDARQGQRLQALLGFQEKYIYKTAAAQVIGSSGSEQSRVFYIDKGSADGVLRDDAVITAEGIVGKVRDVFPHTSQVLAVNDQTSGAGVILETTRIRGILRGNANGQLQIVDILADKRIQKGETVLTAGGDQIFPRGLPVGVVNKVVPDPERDSFIDVMVTPAAHLDRLDEVLVIISTQPRFSNQQQQDIATSEELKGSEAAAIKEQKKASDIMAERLPGLIDPKLPDDQQPLHDTSNPNPVAHPPQALHPDRFTPGADESTAPDAIPETLLGTKDAAPDSGSQAQPQKPASSPAGTQTKSNAKPAQTKPSQKTPPQQTPPGGSN
ncbi:MAG TPA: rod shape-determining protein MreC [Terracidiphilus sp.]|jgi:rod shape-determining protein MreC